MYKSLGNKFQHLQGINDVGTNNVDYFQKLCKNSFPIGKYNGHNYVVNLLSNDFSFVDSEQKVNNINFY